MRGKCKHRTMSITYKSASNPTVRKVTCVDCDVSATINDQENRIPYSGAEIRLWMAQYVHGLFIKELGEVMP